MAPKEFIKTFLIDELNDIVNRHPYLSFTFIGIGIEFLGKCLLDHERNWHRIKPDKAFKEGVKLLHKIDTRYKTIDLHDELRHGFAHTLSPKSKVRLTRMKYGYSQFDVSQNGTILVAEVIYADFVKACHIVVNKSFPPNSKMNQAFLTIT